MKILQVILVTLLTPAFAFGQYEEQEKYVQSILKIVEQGDYTNNYNLKRLGQEIHNIERFRGKQTSIMTFEYDEYKIVESSNNRVVVNFRYPNRKFQVPSKWNTQRTFNLVSVGESFKLKDSTKLSGSYAYIYFYTEKPLNVEPDKWTDFSQDFMDLESSNKEFRNEVTTEFSPVLSKDLSPIFLSKANNIEGAIGGYKRLQVHYEKVKKVNNTKYQISGKTRASKNICDFTGTIEILKSLKFKEIWELDHESPSEHLEGGVILSKVILQEDTNQKGSGTFEGTLCTYWYWDTQNKVVQLHDLNNYSDSYRNNTFVGLWKSSKTKFQQKAIWGIGELPYTEDLDIGAGGISINEKYVQNGWNEEKPNWWNE